MSFLKVDFSNKRTSILLSITVVIIVYLFVISPGLHYWSTVNKRVNAKRDNYYEQKRLLGKMDALKSKYATYEKELQFHRTDTQESIKAFFLKEAESIVRGGGLKIVDVKVLPVIEESREYRFLIQMESEGTMDQLTSLLYQIGTTESLMQINNLSIERKDAASQTLLINFVFSRVKFK